MFPIHAASSSIYRRRFMGTGAALRVPSLSPSSLSDEARDHVFAISFPSKRSNTDYTWILNERNGHP